MRALLIGLLTVAGIAMAIPVSVSPAAAQGVIVDTPVGGVRVGRDRDYDRDHDRRRYRETTGFRERSDRDCRTITVRRDDGSVRQTRRCD